MNLRRLTRGERIAAVSAALLLAFTFLHWYSVSFSVYGISVSFSASAWDALDVIPIVLVIGIAATLGLIALKASGADRDLAIDGAQMIAAIGAGSFLLILYRIFERPTIGSGSDAVEFSAQFGIFAALIAAGGVALGGWRAMLEGDLWGSTANRGPAGGDGEAQAAAGASQASSFSPAASSAKPPSTDG